MVVRRPNAESQSSTVKPPATQSNTETPKRGPGRPPGSPNKPKATDNPNQAKPITNDKPTNLPPPRPNTVPAAQTAPTQKTAISATKPGKDNARKDTPQPPDFSEWQDFLGEIVLHWFSVAFVAVAFRGIDYRHILSQEDYEDIQLDEEELAAVARPFAHLLTHSKLNGKYGRAIMNSRDSIEAAVILFMWGARVNRISKAYRRRIQEVTENVPSIPRPDRARDSNEEVEPESVQPITVANLRPAFGHGYN